MATAIKGFVLAGALVAGWWAKGATRADSTAMGPDPNGASTNITLNLANASPGGLHPWAVHWGQCGAGTDDGVLGPSAAYKPLKDDSDGHAKGIATFPLETPKTGSYFVTVRASAANPEMIVACGNLAPPTQ